MTPRYFSLEEALNLIDEPNRSSCIKMLADNKGLFQTVQGSTHNHQAWPGGYRDHVQEICNIAIFLYPAYNGIRRLPFSLSDALLVLFLHDLEKPWKYETGEDKKLHHIAEMKTKADHQSFRMKKLKEYGIKLTPEQENGLKYAEGELDDYSGQKRVMGPLAAFAHLCDVTSARIWFDHPLAQGDAWTGAARIAEQPG